MEKVKDYLNIQDFKPNEIKRIPFEDKNSLSKDFVKYLNSDGDYVSIVKNT